MSGTDPHASLDLPSQWVARFAPNVSSGEVLDLACGAGRHARFFAARGHHVIAVDRDRQMLARAQGAGVTTLQIDLESEPADPQVAALFARERFAGVVVTNYLHRPLFPAILASLAPGGILLYETFALGNEHFGKPSNLAFLLAPGELISVVQSAGSMRVLAFEDGFVESPRPAMVQRICAVRAKSDTPTEQFRLF